MRSVVLAGAILLLGATAASADHVSTEHSGVKLVYDHALPNVPGKSLKGVLVEYAPGGSSPAHIHPHPRSSTQPCWKGRSGARSTAARSSSTKPARASQRCPAIGMA